MNISQFVLVLLLCFFQSEASGSVYIHGISLEETINNYSGKRK